MLNGKARTHTYIRFDETFTHEEYHMNAIAFSSFCYGYFILFSRNMFVLSRLMHAVTENVMAKFGD